MVASVGARAALAQELIDTVMKRTDGVPLFLVGLCRKSRELFREQIDSQYATIFGWISRRCANSPAYPRLGR